MKVLITAWSFPGHINPTMAIARSLQDRGHDVAFCTGRRAQETVEQQGLRCFPFQDLDEDAVYEAVFSRRSRSLLYRADVLRRWLVSTIPDQVRDTETALDSWRPDAVLCDITFWGPPLILRETRRLPLAVCSFAPGCMAPGRQAPPWGFGLPAPTTWRRRLLSLAAQRLTDWGVAGFRREVDRVRSQYDLPPLAAPVHQHLTTMPLYLVPSVRELDFHREDTPAGVRYIGPLIWNKAAPAETPSWLAGIRTDQPWVHVTEGTMHAYKAFLLEAAARGLAGLPMQVIMTTGDHRDPRDLGLLTAAPNIHVERWAPHKSLFERTAAVVTTGGAGTVLTALAAGVPLVIVPTEWDKADNAQRVVEAGAAIRLSPRACKPGGLRRAVQRVLTEPSYRSSAQRLAAILRQQNGPKTASELLEEAFAPTAAVV